MMKRFLPVLIISVVLITLMAGCAQPAPSPTPAPAPTAKPAPATTAAPAPSPSPTAKLAATPSPTVKEKRVIRLMAGTSGGSVWNWFIVLQSLAEKHSPWLRFDVLPSAGTVANLHNILEGKTEVGLATWQYLTKARKGIGEYQDLGPRNDVKMIFGLSRQWLTVSVLDKSDIKTLSSAALKGKKIATLAPGGATAVITQAYLNALGLDPKNDVKMLYLSTTDAISALLDGTADVYFYTGGAPASTMVDLFNTKPCRLIPIPSEVTKKANELTQAGLFEETLAAKMYKGQDQPVPTAMWSMMSASLDRLDPDVTYELARLWWGYMDERNAASADLARQATVDALKGDIKAMEAEFHSGALKYYKEKGWVQ